MDLFDFSFSAGVLLPPAAAVAVFGIVTTCILLRDHLRLERHSLSLETEIERLTTQIERLTADAERNRVREARSLAFSADETFATPSDSCGTGRNDRTAAQDVKLQASASSGHDMLAGTDQTHLRLVTNSVAEQARSIVAQPSPSAVRRILLAEDDDTNAQLALNALKSSGAAIDWARDGAEAVSMVERAFSDSCPYDVVLMDLRMPRLDGYEATQHIRALEASLRCEKPTRIIAVSATTMRRDRVAAEQAGVDAFLSKPYLTDTLRQLLSPRSEAMAAAS